MMRDVEVITHAADVQDMIGRYRFAEKFMAFCKDCDNYNANWACPPFDFDTLAYVRPYRYAYVFGVKFFYSPEAIAEADTLPKSIAHSETIFWHVKRTMLDLLFHLEEKYTDGIGVSAGGCHLCAPCSRIDGLPCRFPDNRRHSLESLGFDLSMISEDLLGIELQWIRETLPPYQSLINVFFTKDIHDAVPGAIQSYLEANL